MCELGAQARKVLDEAVAADRTLYHAYLSLADLNDAESKTIQTVAL